MPKYYSRQALFSQLYFMKQNLTIFSGWIEFQNSASSGHSFKLRSPSIFSCKATGHGFCRIFNLIWYRSSKSCAISIRYCCFLINYVLESTTKRRYIIKKAAWSLLTRHSATHVKIWILNIAWQIPSKIPKHLLL